MASYLDKDPPRSSLNIDIRYTDQRDAVHLKKWLMDDGVSRWFPMMDELEVDDAVRKWISFARYRCSLTAVYQGLPIGIATLYLQPYKKLAHQAEFGIIVSPEHRGQSVGSELLNNLLHLAKEKFRMELVHLQVYDENPAKRLYERFGFKEYGKQDEWIKESDGSYRARVFMERRI